MHGYRQVHLWLRDQEFETLRRLAADRDQSMSAAIRFLLKQQARVTASHPRPESSTAIPSPVARRQF
jgi:hypothetical protein